MPIVCVDGLIQNISKEYLLVKRINEPLKNEYWVPGGRIVKNERIEDAIKRKMKQELNIGIKVKRLLGFFEDFYKIFHSEIFNEIHFVSFVFLLTIDDQDKIILDNQSSDWKWCKALPPRLIDKLQIIGDNVL